MLTAIIGLLTAISYGFADFFAAIATRRLQVAIVTAGASMSGLIVLVAVSPIFGAAFTVPAILWGVAGGLCSVFALTSLYKSLALGPISIVSPLGALASAIVPAVIGVTTNGEKFGASTWLAIGIALVAVVLVGFVPGENVTLPKPRALILALIAGVGIGFTVTAMAMSPHDSGIAPVIAMRGTAALLLAVIALIGIQRNPKLLQGTKDLPKKIWLTIALAGGLDAVANILFTLGSRLGSLTVIGVLTALYPLGTILLARVVLKEHVATTQKIGIALTLVASLLLTLA